MDFRERPLAIVDVETSGDDELKHEILEIGLLVLHQKDLIVTDSANWKIKPHHIENSVPAALERNGYNDKDWQDAMKLAEVMPAFSQKVQIGGVYLKISERNWLGSAGGRAKTTPPFRPPRLACPTETLE